MNAKGGRRTFLRSWWARSRAGSYSGFLSHWVLSAICASAFCALEELAVVSLHFPPAGSDIVGTVAWIVAAASAVFPVAAVLGVLLSIFEAKGARNPVSDAGVLSGLLLSGTAVAGLLALVLAVFERQAILEFPEDIRAIRFVALFLVVLFGMFAAHLVIVPGLKKGFEKLTFLRSVRLVLGSALFVLSLALLFFANLVMARVHMNHETLYVSLIAVSAALCAMRLWLPPVPVRYRSLVFVAGFSLLLVGPVVAQRNAHGSFLLFGHSHGVSQLAILERDLLDFDGDGASPLWLGGADCDEFNALIGPGRREKLGDGIDQDCRGGDAKRRPAAPQTNPIKGCAVATVPSNVFVLSVDALRADSVRPQFAPTLVALQNRMVRFSRAYAPATSTQYSFGSMFSNLSASDASGDNPLQTNAFEIGTTLAARFSGAGYETVLFEPDTLAEPFRVGFTHHNPFRDSFDLYNIPAKAVFSGAGMTSAALRALEAMQGRKVFLWMHYLDVHAPYVIPLGDAPPSDFHPYDGLIQYVDHQIGRFFRALQERGLLDKSIIVVTADHGEGLGQHGRDGHGVDLFEEVVHVPLLLWVPGCPAQTIDEPVSLLHLGATLGELTGVDVPGRTLSPGTGLPVVSEVVRVQGRFKRAVIADRYKLIVDVQNGGRLLFDLQQDPGETRDVYAERPSEAHRLEQAYQDWLDSPGVR